MELIEDHSVGIETVLVGHIRRQDFVFAVGRIIYDGTCGLVDGNVPFESRAEHHHIHSYIKYDLGLIDIGSTAIDLGSLFAVRAGKIQRDGGSKLGLAHLLRDLHIGRRKLPVAVWLQCSEYVSHDLLLPVDQFKGLLIPFTLGVLKALDKGNSKVSGVLVIVGILSHEVRRCIIFKFSDRSSPPKGHKK